ncbi:MAG: AroM family protein [Desulfurococcales archaeon]|nr:AroM family protein [Desulfurococcales archaeon]
MIVGFVTIGQSPRTDVLSEIRQYLGRAEVVECGALDGLTLKDVEELRPGPGEYILVTRMREGTQVKLGREKIRGRVQGCVDKVSEVADVVVFICTGEFPGIKTSKIFIDPSTLLENVVKALGVRRLGVIIPSPEQKGEVRGKWEGVADEVCVEASSPYSGSDEALREAASHLKDCDVVVLDCVGYGLGAKEIVREVSGRPVILARTLIGRVVGELVV